MSGVARDSRSLLARGKTSSPVGGNPFTAARLRPGQIAYHFPPGDDLAALLARLAENRGHGQIVGEHGSGKSTLLAMLAAALEARGHRVVRIELRDGQRRLPRDWQPVVDLARPISSNSQTRDVHDKDDITPLLPATLIFVDGYEQLGWPARWRLWRGCRRAGWGLVVTSHVSAGWPTLATTRVDLATARAVVDALNGDAHSPPSPAEVTDAFARCGGNLREMLFDLYDRYEAHQRQLPRARL